LRNKKSWGKKQCWGEKEQVKNGIFWFYAKAVADTGLWSAPLERTQKTQPESQKSKLFDNFLSTSQQFLNLKLP